MSDENRPAPGSQGGPGKSKRVGTAERGRAIAILGEHWHAGRLDPAEHERRVTQAKQAVTQADLDVLFADLPSTAVAQEPARTVSTPAAGGLVAGRHDTIMALTPFAALLLFFLTGTWLWFLLVPVMGILLYGPGGKKNPRQPEQ
jgi:hypothetical protein